MVELMSNPPRPGDYSFELYQREYTTLFESLERRGRKLTETLCQLSGVFCHPSKSSMYAFPSITIPAAAVETAHKAGMAPDALYCLELLEHTGVVRCVPDCQS